jgi:hypothetical protein
VASKGATPSSAAGGSSPTTSTTAPGPAPAPTSESASPPSAPSAPGVHLPAEGTYRYTVTGDEAASGFGSRAYPAEMSASVHGGDGVAADETVLDLHFSDDHEERLVLAVEGSGLVARYEGGSITFGPGTQTSQADYRPPMLLVPTDSGQRPRGSVTKGSSEAHDGDSVSRVEDWTVTSLGTETIDVLGHPTETWVVKTERQSRPDSAEQVHRVRTAWYDPARGIWVRWTEKFDGYRTTFGVKFSYRSDYTATLAGVA